MTQIAFTGDIAFTKHFSGSCSDEKLLSDEIVKFLSSSDYTVLNVEGAVSAGPISAVKSLTHANPPECVEWFKKINGNIWNIANNHSMDCGADGLESTLRIAHDNNFMTIGAGMNITDAQKPLIIDKDGGIGIVSVASFVKDKADDKAPGCFVPEDEEILKKQINEVKKKCRWCIVVSHAGQEFSQMPLPYLRRSYKRYLKYGADIVVGHHPHVVQNYETFGKKVVFYSLGNFIFDTDYQRIQRYTDCGILIKINFNENGYSWDFLPVKNDRETLNISECKAPAIFRNITSFEYGLLWPLAAKQLSRNERKKKTFLHPEFAERSWLDWLLKYDIENCKRPYGKNVMLGKFLSLFCFWKFADKNIVQYIQEK